MKAIVVFDGRFSSNEDGPSSYHLTYDLFTKRYLSDFESVTVVGRLFEKAEIGASPVIGENASFIGVPGYVGPSSFVKKIPSIIKILWNLDLTDSAIFLRTPGTIPFLLTLILILKRVPYVVEVVADPNDQLSKGAVEHPIRIVFQKLYVFFLKFQCKNAFAASYVTQYALQKRYPTKTNITSHYTSLNLTDDWFINEPRVYTNINRVKILHVGMMVQLYKAQDVLIDACKVMKSRGVDFEVTFIGDGEYRNYLENYAKELNVLDKIYFVGKVSDRDVIKKYYDSADIFVLPSRQEGLPRVMIEAMSRGMPCIGSNVGGIPELLEDGYMVEVDKPENLANKIIDLHSNSDELNRQSLRNLSIAKFYNGKDVQTRRRSFYAKIKAYLNEKN